MLVTWRSGRRLAAIERSGLPLCHGSCRLTALAMSEWHGSMAETLCMSKVARRALVYVHIYLQYVSGAPETGSRDRACARCGRARAGVRHSPF